MKTIWIILAASCAATGFAQSTAPSATSSDSSGKTAVRAKKKKRTAATASNPAQITIPKGAVMDPKDGNYHYTDKSGRKWVYMMTPMGPSRWEDKGTANTAKPRFETSNRFSRDPNLKAVDKGDSVEFIRSTPFGPQTWTKKKSDLTDDERAMIPGQPAEAKNADKAQN